MKQSFRRSFLHVFIASYLFVFQQTCWFQSSCIAGIIIQVFVHFYFLEINENAYQGLMSNDWILASRKHHTGHMDALGLLCLALCVNVCLGCYSQRVLCAWLPWKRPHCNGIHLESQSA